MCFQKHLLKWRSSFFAPLRLSTSCGLFAPPALHRLTMTTTTDTSEGLPWWIIWDLLERDKHQQQRISSRILEIWEIHLLCLFRYIDYTFPSVHCNRKYPWRSSRFTQYLKSHELLCLIFENNSMLCYQLLQPTGMYLNYFNWRCNIKGLTFGNQVFQVTWGLFTPTTL